MGQIEIEAGVGRGEADVGAGARREPRLGQAAVAGAGVGRPQAGEAQRGRLVEFVDEAELQLLALFQAQERPGRCAGIGEGRRGSAGGRGQRETRRARPRRGESRPAGTGQMRAGARRHAAAARQSRMPRRSVARGLRQGRRRAVGSSWMPPMDDGLPRRVGVLAAHVIATERVRNRPALAGRPSRHRRGPEPALFRWRGRASWYRARPKHEGAPVGTSAERGRGGIGRRAGFRFR